MSKKWLLALGGSLVYAPMSMALGLGEINIKSKLNQTLDAEIEITSSTREELDNLVLSIPSDDVFARYDLDRPALLSNISFSIENRTGSRKVIQITSNNVVKDPFLTFLVQADWPQGRMLREYTVLVDPPLYVPAGSDSQTYIDGPATTTRDATRTQGTISGRTETGTYSSDTSDQFNYSSESYGDSYSVKRGDTLWEIANSLRPDDTLTVNQTMMAIFRSNPEAFEGNINRLKAGQILSIPTRNQINQVGTSSANQAVREQTQEWRASTGSYASSSASSSGSSQASSDSNSGGRLELKVPSIASDADLNPDGSEEIGEINPEYEDRIRELQAKNEEFERLISAKDNELAALQQELGKSLEEEQSATDTEAVDPEAADPLEAETPDEESASELEGQDSELPTDENTDTSADSENPETQEPAADAQTSDSPDAESPAVETPEEPVAEEEPAAVSTPVASTPQEDSGLMGLLIKIGLGLLGLLAAVFGFLFLKNRKKGPSHDTLFVDEDLDSQVEDIAEAIKTKVGKKYGSTAEVEILKEDTASIEVSESSIEESGVDFNFGDDTDASADADVPVITDSIESDEALPFDDTTLADVSMGSMEVDSNDPLAETDFHMAYGLYDQAAEIMSSAITETNNFEFKEKLLEVFFVSGNKEEFIRYATEIKDEALEKHPNSWENVVIMGKQIAPENALFSGDVSTAGIDEGLDFSLDQTGANEVDSSLFGDLDNAAESKNEDATDLDFALEATAATTGIGSDAGIELDNDVLDISMSLGLPDAPVDLEGAIENFGSDLDASLSNTATNIGMKGIDEEESDAEATREISVDDFLDLDIGSSTETSEALDLVTPDSAASDDDVLDFDLDLSELGVEGLGDDQSDETMDFSLDSEESDDTQNIADDFLNSLDGDATSTQEMQLDDNFDLLLDSNEATQNAGLDLDLDTLLSDSVDPFPDDTKRSMLPDGVDESDSGTMSLNTLDDNKLNAEKIKEVLNPDDMHASTSQISDEELAAMGLSDDGPELMSITGMTLDDDVSADEVSTKIDLARAYIEMEDPDNAKSILQEVIEEGTEAQISEAKSIIASLS